MDGYLYTDRSSFDKGLVDLWVQFTAGTSGVVPSTFTRAKGVATIVLTSTGLLTINLSDVWAYNYFAEGSITQNTLSASTGMIVTPHEDSNVSHATTPKLVFNMLSAAGAAADMGTGDVFRMHAVLGRLKL